MRRLLLSLASIIVSMRPSEACSRLRTTVLEMFDEVPTVAYVRVGQVPEGKGNRLGAGPVQLVVKRMLKGGKRSQLVTFETNTSCRIGFRRGKQALVFIDKDRQTWEYFEEFDTWVALLDNWAHATSDVTKRSILVDAITGSDAVVADEAAFYLQDRPDLLVKLDADQRATIAGATAVKPMKFVLARLNASSKFESETDVGKLADAILAGTDNDPDRIAALERCERVHAKKLFRYSTYQNGTGVHLWPELADACRSGVPFSW